MPQDVSFELVVQDKTLGCTGLFEITTVTLRYALTSLAFLVVVDEATTGPMEKRECHRMCRLN